MCLPPCRSRRTRWQKPRSPRSTTPRTATTPSRRSKPSRRNYGAKWPKAVAKITQHVDVLLAFFDYPAQHWIHLRTTNRVDLRHHQAASAGHQGTRLARRRSRDGVQAHRVRTSPLACRQHATSSLWSAPAPASRKGNSSNDPTNSVRCSRKHHILPTSTRRWNRCGAIRRRRPQRCSTRLAGIFPTATSPRPPAKPRPSTAAGWQTRI
jgi:uncharacterized protein YdaU (DUF1376 family)